MSKHKSTISDNLVSWDIKIALLSFLAYEYDMFISLFIKELRCRVQLRKVSFILEFLAD